MGNTFATGFFGAVGDKLKEVADKHKQNDDALRDIKAKSLHDAISSGNLNHDQMTAALDELQKLYPKSKGIKGAFDKVKQITDLFHKHGGGDAAGAGGGQPQSSAPGQPPAMDEIPRNATTGQPIKTSGAMSEQIPGMNASSTGPNAPSLPSRPAPASATQSPQSGGSAPKSSPAPPPSMADIMSAAHPSPEQQDARAVKFAGDKEAAIIKAQTQAQREAHINHIKEFKDDYREAMGHDPSEAEIQTYFKMTPPPKITTKLEQDPQSPTGWAFVSYDQLSGKEYSRQQNAPPQRGLAPTESDTTSTDAFGNVSHSHTSRKPIIGGQGGQGAAASTSSPTSKSKSAPAAPPKINGTTTSSSSPAPSGEAPKLDAEGHIPTGSGNGLVIEAANQLLDGSDKDKLPAKVREPAAQMARKYGWEQGKFTPKEQLMLREATTFLNEAATNPSMSVLDSTGSKLKLGQVLAASHDQGFIGRAASTIAASNMTEPEAEFVRMYNQLVGTISGLSQLVRSGRATEAQIDRLKNELPNVLQAKDSADGRKRIQRILKEVDIALKKGTFEGTSSSSKSAPTAPPNMSDSSSSMKPPSGAVIHWTRDAKGNPVQASQ